LIFLFAGIGYLVTRFKKKKVKFMVLLRLAVFSSTIMMILDIMLGPVINLGILPLLLYIAMFFLAVYFTGGKKITFEKDDKEK
jgi:hypothetical protein